MTRTHYHTVEDEWLASFCAGGLSRAKRFVLSCQAAINPRLSERIEAYDAVGGALVESAKGEALSDDFMSRVFAKLETPDVKSIPKDIAPDRAGHQFGNWVPGPLAEFLHDAGKSLDWKNMGFGVARVPLLQEGREKLYLLKVPPGMKMPKHTHHGEEWALVLQGGYHVGDAGYVRGDVHREDESCTHQPIIDDHGEPCITLVASEGGLKFTNPVMGLLKPFIGI